MFIDECSPTTKKEMDAQRIISLEGINKERINVIILMA